MKLDLNEENLVKKTFLVAWAFTLYAFYYDFYMAKMPLTKFNITIKIIFIFLPILVIYIPKRIPMYWRMYIAMFVFIIYSAYYTYFLSLAYLATSVQISFVFTILLIFELREFLVLSILTFALTLLAGLYSPNLYSISHFGEVRRGEDVENFVSLYLMTMIAYGLVTYPRLKKLKEEYKFSQLGKATSFIVHEISKPLLNLNSDNKLNEEVIEELKNKLEIARQLQEGIISNKKEKILIADLIQEILDENDKFLKYYNLAPKLKLSEIYWVGDRKLVKTIVSNLIKNAIEALTLVLKDCIFEITITDNKLIIVNSFHTTLDQKDLFSPMKSSKSGNMGMGLYISKSLAESQNIDLKVKTIGKSFICELIARGE